MTERPTGYGYFITLEELQKAVDARKGDKSGGAVVFKGATKIIRDAKGVRLKGQPTTTLLVKVLPGGELDIRSDDSFDNE